MTSTECLSAVPVTHKLNQLLSDADLLVRMRSHPLQPSCWTTTHASQDQTTILLSLLKQLSRVSLREITRPT